MLALYISPPKFRILTEDLSTKDLDSGVDIKLLKLKRAKELLKKKRLLDPEIPRPREHWYEMKSPQFHMEMRKNTEHLRMLCDVTELSSTCNY